MVVATRLLLLLAIAGASLAQQRSLSTSTRRRNRLPAGKSEVLDFSCPEDFGYYQHPTDCTQYYVCVFGGALQESCSGGLVYSHDLQTCDWPRNVVCNVDLAGPVSTVRITDPRTSEPPRQRAQGQSLTPSVSSNGFAETFRTSAGRSQDQQQSGPSSTAVNRQGRIIQGQSDVKQQQPIREKFQGQESTNRAFSIPQTTSRSFSFPWMKELGQKRDQLCCSGTLRLDEDNMITRRRRRSISPVLDSHDKMAASSSVDRPDVDSETSPSARYSTFARPDRPNNRHSVNADATSLPGLSLISDSSDSTLFSDRRLTSPSNKQALDFFSLDSIEEDLDSQQSRYFGDESYQRSEVGFQGPLRRRRRRPYFGKNRIRAVGPSAFSFHGSNNQFHGPSSVRFPPQIVNPFQPQYHKPSEEIPRQKESILQTYPRDEINSNEFPPSIIEKSKNKIPSSFSSLSSGSPFSHFLISHSTNGGLEVSVPGSDRPKPMPQAINPFDGRQPVHDYTFPYDDRPEYVDRPAYVNRPEQADRPEYVDRPSHVDRPSNEERTPYDNRPAYNERPRYEKRPVHNEKPSNEARQPQYQSSQHERPVSQQKGEYLPNPLYETEHDRNWDKQAEDDRHNRPYVPYSSHTSRVTSPPPIQPNPTKYTVGYQNFNSQEQQSPEKSFPMFHAPVSSPKRQPGPAITHTPPPRSEEYNRPPYAPPQFSRPSKGDDGFLLPTPGTTFHEELETPLTLYDDEEDKTGIENYFYHTDEPRPYLPTSYEQEPVTRSGPDENVYYQTSAERHLFRQPSLSVERPISPPIDSYKKQSLELSYEDQGPLPPSRDQYSSVQQDNRTPGPSHESTESTPSVRNRKPLPPYRNRRPELVSEEQESEPLHTEKPSDERITEAPRRPTRPKIQVPRRSHKPKTPTEATTTPSTTRAPPFKPFSMPPFKKPTSVRERGGSRHKTTLAAKPIHIPGTARHPDFSKLSAADDSSSTSDSVFSTSDQKKTQDEQPNYRGSQQSQSVKPAPVELEPNFYSDLLNLTDDEYFYLYDDLLLEDYFDATATTTTPRSVARSPIRTNTKSSSQPQGKVSTDSSRPARLTVKPVSEVLKNTNHLISNVWKYPPRRPASLYPTPPVNSIANKCDRKACRLPDCNCGGKEVPGGLAPQDVPQLVMLTFDDSVNDLNKELYQDLFERGRTNPNGCPLAATFYVSHEWTDYSQVQNLYADGHEIASHSVTHSFGEQFSKLKWAKEIAGQREIMAAYGGVNMEDIRGMRAPFLAVGGNKMFEMLYEQNFTYDSSMPVYENRPPSYPYTLDYKLFHDCMIPPCPTNSFPGLWEVPMVMWQDLNGGRCSMGDACTTPPDAEGVYKMLIKNFERHYTTNRAPMGLFYHAAWFTTAHHKEGFIAFLDTISGMPDVWLVTNWQALQWVRDPVPLSQAKTFKPFECNYPGRPARCKSHKVCNVWHKGGVRYMRTCQRCPEAYPWVGATGVDSPLNDI